jgi:large subunit ribosomal protein L4
MPSVTVVDQTGKARETLELEGRVFAAPVNVGLVHQAVVREQAGHRAGTHDTKGRSEVSGGGKKPWRQKGTGRARQGSIRSPQWAGGGVAHGPHPRDHSMRVNKKMRRGALRAALTDTVQSGKLAVVSELAFDAPKTKQALELLAAFELEGKVLVILPAPTDSGAVELSFRNLRSAKVVYAGGLGVYDLLNADRVLITVGALDALEGKDVANDDEGGGAA